MKRAVLLGFLLSLVVAPAAFAASKDDLGIELRGGAVMSDGAVYTIADGRCRYPSECQKLRRTDALTAVTSTAKQAKGEITGLVSAGSQVAFSEWDQHRGRSAIWVRNAAGAFAAPVTLRNHARGCNDTVVVNAVSPEGAILWTRFINRGCTSGRFRFEATKFVLLPGEAPRRLGAKRTLSDFEADSSFEPSLHPDAASVVGRRALVWDWPRAYLYDLDTGSKTRLVSDYGWFDQPPIGLGPGGEVVVSRVFDKRSNTGAPVLHPNPAALSYAVPMREEGTDSTTFRFCGNRIVTFVPYADGGKYSVRDLTGAVVKSAGFSLPGDDIRISELVCDASTIVAELDDPDTEVGIRTAAVPLP